MHIEPKASKGIPDLECTFMSSEKGGKIFLCSFVKSLFYSTVSKAHVKLISHAKL